MTAAQTNTPGGPGPSVPAHSSGVLVPSGMAGGGAARGEGSRRVVEAQQVVKAFRRSSGLLGMGAGRQGRKLLAVNNVSFHIDEGEVVGLVGESGSGKTTLGKALLKLHSIDGGRILLDGQEVQNMPEREWNLLRPRYQMVFQNPHSSLNPGMRVRGVLEETVALHLKLTGAEASQRIEDILRVVGLSEKIDAYPKQLSGGEKRRVGLARVLLLKPRLVVADEPTAGLDASLKAGIVHLMLEARTPEMAYLFISHDLHLIRYVSNRILVMFRGVLVEVVPQGGFELGLPHHPYTELLLQSFHLGGGRRRTVSLTPPSPAENLSLLAGDGCCYYSHCSRAKMMGEKAAICRTSTPPTVPTSDGGAIACFFV